MTYLVINKLSDWNCLTACLSRLFSLLLLLCLEGIQLNNHGSYSSRVSLNLIFNVFNKLVWLRIKRSSSWTKLSVFYFCLWWILTILLSFILSNKKVCLSYIVVSVPYTVRLILQAEYNYINITNISLDI